MIILSYEASLAGADKVQYVFNLGRVGDFFLYLCKQVRRRIPAAKRFVLRYIRNKI